MNDIENEVKRLLNEQVDARLGPRRTPPAFTAPTAAERAKRRWFTDRRAPWALPLLAAACVAAVVGATAIAASGLLADDKQAPPVNSMPAPSPSPSVVPSPTASLSATTTPTPTTSTATSAPNTESTSAPNHLKYENVELGGATIAVPAGWKLDNPVGSGQYTQWCLQPIHPDAVARASGCAINFSVIDPPASAHPAFFDVDIEGWGSGDPPQYCAPDRPQMTEQTGDRSFGGRMADWRLFDRSCPDGKTYESEQYVVATNPAYAMFAWMSDAEIHAAMTEIAEYSILPQQQDPLRLADRGVLETVDRGQDGVTVTIDRVVRAVNSAGERIRFINNNPATYTYLVPTTLFDEASVGVGVRVRLETNGRQVLTFSRDSI